MSGAGGGYNGSSFGGFGGGGGGGGYGGYAGGDGDAAELEARVGALEAQLSGVSNLRGKLAALEHMAAEVVGLPIPDMDADPTLDLDTFYLEEEDEEEGEEDDGTIEEAQEEEEEEEEGEERRGEEWEQAGSADGSEGEDAASSPEGGAHARGKRGVGRRAVAGTGGVAAAAAAAEGLAQAPLAADDAPEGGNVDGAPGTTGGAEPAVKARSRKHSAKGAERQSSRGTGGTGGDVDEAADEGDRPTSAGSLGWPGNAEHAGETTGNKEEGDMMEPGSAATADPELPAAGEHDTELGPMVDGAAEGVAHGKGGAAAAAARRAAGGAERPPALQLGETSAGATPRAGATAAPAAAPHPAKRLKSEAKGRTGSPLGRTSRTSSPLVGPPSKTKSFKMPLTAHLESQLAELAAHVDANSGELRSIVDALRRELRSLVGGDASGGGRGDGDGSGKEDEPEGQEAAVEKLGRIGILEADLMYIREMLPEDGIVSRADFNTLKNHTIDVTNELNSLLAEVETLRDQDMALLQDSVAELQDFRDETAAAGGAAGGGGGSGANDAHFHQRISVLESRMEDIKGEVQLVVMDCIDDVAKASDLDDLTAVVDAEKASKEEVRQLAQQQAQLALSVNSVAECVAEMRADGGGGGAASGATRFKCLTCNSELDGPRSGTGGGTPQQQAAAVQQRERERGAFLPRLEGAGAGQAQGHPVGPGLSAAEFRKRVSPSATSPLRGTDFAEYGTGGGGGIAKGGPTTRTADGRVAVTMPVGGLRIPAGPKTPVFIA